ncbi:hypothetical protein FSS13T_27150 [Flavobacterium saliperosum S13]|uniref:Uncharacterized protein n=1 Tax=Flavobacterium saliperosum S13 TaxID=1341155 RepID=A0ABP2ZU26_9FLAO|nr:hypothetical protein [Flavobacterium saliperosum]ESU21396.1 hypothetical protein FSS13T_27150 [Flavobacterium saliperosum S13]
MKKKNYIAIVLICTAIILVNYLTDFMFMANNEPLIFMWTFINIVVFPIWITNYIYKIAKLNGKSNFILSGIVAIISYLSTYIVPFIDYFNFQTLSLNGDGATKAILTGIMFLGLIVVLVSLLIFHFKLKTAANRGFMKLGL